MITQSVIPFPVQQERLATTSHPEPEYEETASPVALLNIKQAETAVEPYTSSQGVHADSKSQGQVRESDILSLLTQVEKESKYAVVDTSFSGALPTLPIDSKVVYEEIDIRATHVR